MQSYPDYFEGYTRYVVYSRSPKVGNPIASILKSHVQGIPALFGLNPVSNFLGFTIEGFEASLVQN